MVYEIITSFLTQFIGSLSIAGAWVTLEPLVTFTVWMAIYALLIFKFYRFVARKDVFRLSQGGHKSVAKRIVYGLEYLFLFPLVVFFWFMVISLLLAMLSEVISIGNIFLVAMATVATIRISAYFNENLSQDIAKLIPFALLAVLLLDITTISYGVAIQVIAQVPAELLTIFYYFVFIVALEFLFKIVHHGKSPTYVSARGEQFKPTTPKPPYGKNKTSQGTI